MTAPRIEFMCPHCGWRFDALLAHDNPFGSGLVPKHDLMTAQGERIKSAGECPGSNQAPRNPESDRRPLWKDLPGERSPTEHERQAPALCAVCGRTLRNHPGCEPCRAPEVDKPTPFNAGALLRLAAACNGTVAGEILAALRRIDEQDRELQARREILDALSDAAGNGNCWLNAATLDWRQRLRDFAEDSEQHRIDRDAWRANHQTFPGVVFYVVGGFYVAYYDDAAELWQRADDDRPMFHVMVESDPPHRTVIHPLHLHEWLTHLAEVCLPATVLSGEDLHDTGEADDADDD